MSDDPVHPAVRETAADIADMEVRGAAAIADAAAGALADQATASDAATTEAFRMELYAAARELHDTRPTAVSLPNALRYVLRDLQADSVEALRGRVLTRIESFRSDLAAAQDRLGAIGAGRLRDGETVMLHCHSTDAMACVRAAVEDGKAIEAIVKETRPRNQGHITASRLTDLDVPVKLIVDSAAHRFLDEADHVLAGADSIAADGSVVNKIGTSGLAVSARERGVPVMIAAQSVKLHPDTLTGTTVEIEERDSAEVLDPQRRDEIGDVQVCNPAFDVTPPRYIDAIITEHGQFPPESVVTLIRELFGTGTDLPWAAE